MRICAAIAILAIAATAAAENMFTDQELRYLDDRFVKRFESGTSPGGLTTTTIFGSLGNVSGFYNTLTYTETDPVFGPWLTSFSATNTPGLTTDNTTTTNDGTRISVKNYDTNVFAMLNYRMTVEDSWEATARGRINATRWRDTGPTRPLATRWIDRGGP